MSIVNLLMFVYVVEVKLLAILCLSFQTVIIILNFLLK